MSSKVKLWLNLVAIVIVFAIIVISVGALLTKDSRFLEVPGTKSDVADLSMNIKGSVNGTDFFIISFVDGKADDTIKTINTEEMTFTEERPVIDFDMSFENRSDAVLYIQITGIYLDTAKFPTNPRFFTTTYINNVQRLIKEEIDGTGTILLELQPLQNDDLTPNIEDGSLVNFLIKYELNTYNRNINNQKQDLLITISKQRFDIEE